MSRKSFPVSSILPTKQGGLVGSCGRLPLSSGMMGILIGLMVPEKSNLQNRNGEKMFHCRSRGLNWRFCEFSALFTRAAVVLQDRGVHF